MNAAAYLSSHGWEGHNRALKPGGISKPVLVSRKKDQAGVGRDRSCLRDNLNHAFDSALKSFNAHGSLKQSPSSTESPQSGLYANFVNAGTLEGLAPTIAYDVENDVEREDNHERQVRKEERTERRKARAERRNERALRKLARDEARRKREPYAEGTETKQVS